MHVQTSQLARPSLESSGASLSEISSQVASLSCISLSGQGMGTACSYCSTACNTVCYVHVVVQVAK
jgi:hypothetical protein